MMSAYRDRAFLYEIKDLDYFRSDTVFPLVLDLQWMDSGEIRFKNSQIKMVSWEKNGKMFLRDHPFDDEHNYFKEILF